MYKLRSLIGSASSSLLIFAAALIAAGNSEAQSIFGEGDFSKVKQQFTSLEAGSAQSAEPIKFSFTTEKFGAFTVSLSESPKHNRQAVISNGIAEVKDTSEVLLLQGSGDINGVTIPVAGSVYRVNGKEELHLNFVAPGADPHTSNGAIPYEITKQLSDSSSPILKSASAAAIQGKKCGTESLNSVSAPILNAPKPASAPGVGASAVEKVIDIATEADFDYFSKYGSSSNSRIASIINTAQVIYQRDLGLRFNIVRQRVVSTASQPYTSSAPEPLLDQLGAVVSSAGGLQGADLVHLFTGKEIEDGVVGLAWVGVLCTTPTLSTSFTQDLDITLDHIIFAHEVGHNLGADHDSALPRSVMYPSVGDDQTNFSLTSRNAIFGYMGQGGDSCFSSVDSSPSPTPVPTAAPTSIPREEDPGDDSGDDDSGDEDSEPYLEFSAAFNARTGKIDIDISRYYVTEGSCTYRLRLGGKSNLSDALRVQVDSDYEYVRFSSKTTKRLSDSRGKIYIRGEVLNCEGGESLKTDILSVKPSSARATRRGDKVSAKAWNQAVIKKMTVTEYE